MCGKTRQNYPWTFLEIALHICIFHGDLIFRRAHISFPPSSPSPPLYLLLSCRARKSSRVHKNSTKEETSLCMSRGLRDRFAPPSPSTTTMMTKTMKNGSIDHFPAGIQFCWRQTFWERYYVIETPRTHDVSQMKDFRREIILIALNKPRFAFIILAHRWSRWLNKLPDRDLIQHRTQECLREN